MSTTASDSDLKIISSVAIWKPFPTTNKKTLMSTVGFCGPIGFHNRCCWCIGIRWDKPGKCWGDPFILPKIIFVYAGFGNLNFFYDKIYPYIPKYHKYILIIGDEDITIPRQTDKRYNKTHSIECHCCYCFPFTMSMWDNFVNNKQIHHIFTTHLDIPKSYRYSPIPVGFNPLEHNDKDIDTLLLVKVDSDIMSRPLKIKGCCRIHGDSAQWDDRRIVKNLAETCWSNFTEWGPIPKSVFFLNIQKYSFLFCPHGGGLEPNPKVFTAIYCCTIPIIKRFVNCEILYKDLPVVFIDDWSEHNITLKKLKLWKEELKPYFYDKNKRREVLKKLTADYWFEYIIKTSETNKQYLIF